MTEKTDTRKVLSANIHVTGKCNYRCAHCFATCLEKSCLTPAEWKPYLQYLESIGITKINLAGGEPLLYPHLEELCALIKSMRFTVSIVSNGSLITEETVERLSHCVDWLGLSVDSPDEEDEIVIGRSNGKKHLEHIVKVSQWARSYGIRVKLNITVVRQSWNKDFHALISEVKPERTKAFRALTLKNANDNRPDTWSISEEQYEIFRERHSDVSGIVFEDNCDMIGTYLMLDPLGRWMVNNGGVKRFLPFEQLVVNGPDSMVDVDGYYGRNGVYGWGEE